MIGSKIGNYRVVTELGAGAMGEVYFAEHAVMGRRAAVKVIREELSSNEEMVQRFINEARLVNRIGHPNIVEITDFGQVGNRYYLMMELLEGETLEERLERAGKLKEESAIEISIQVANALSAAHELGVVHRDLKPENIFLVARLGSSHDFVKVLDFGIAKLNLGSVAPRGSTVPGTILGTPHYMSPEQCMGAADLGHASDVYSLGVVMYRMLTGALPFDGDSLMRVLFAHTHEEPKPLLSLRPDLSPWLADVVTRAMRKDPAERWPSMLDLRRALELGPVSARAAAVTQVDHAIHATLPPEPEPEARLVKPASGPAPIATPVPAVKPKLVTPAPAVAPTPAPAPAPISEPAPIVLPSDPEQSQRVGSRLARILIERIHHDKLVLPNLPSVATECLQLLDNPQRGLTFVATAIGRDPIIAPQVVRRARSALMGGASSVRTIEQAVSRLGARQLRSLLVELSARKLFESRDPEIRRATRNLWEHSVAVGVVARELARRRRDVDPDLVYLSGLLHDVGKPVAAALLLEAERTSATKDKGWLASESWVGAIAECHREVGVAMARSWGLPEEIVHTMARCERYPNEGASSPASVVCFANALVKRDGIYHGEFDSDQVDFLIREGCQMFSLTPEMVEKLLANARTPDQEAAAG